VKTHLVLRAFGRICQSKTRFLRLNDICTNGILITWQINLEQFDPIVMGLDIKFKCPSRQSYHSKKAIVSVFLRANCSPTDSSFVSIRRMCIYQIDCYLLIPEDMLNRHVANLALDRIVVFLF
jgi:hypothetical protein